MPLLQLVGYSYTCLDCVENADGIDLLSFCNVTFTNAHRTLCASSSERRLSKERVIVVTSRLSTLLILHQKHIPSEEHAVIVMPVIRQLHLLTPVG